MNRKDYNRVFESLMKRHMGSPSEGIVGVQHCPDENVVIAYLEGQLPAEVRRSFERHASRCSRCQEEMAVALQAGGPPVDNPHDAVRPILDSRILNEITKIFRNFQFGGFKPALAVLLITVVSGYIGYEIYLQKGAATRPDLGELLTRSGETPSVKPQSSPALSKDVAQVPVKLPPNPKMAAPQFRSQATPESVDAKRVASTEMPEDTVGSTPTESRKEPPGASDKERDVETGARILPQDETHRELFAPVPPPEPLAPKQASQAMGAVQKGTESNAPDQSLTAAGKSDSLELQDAARTAKANSLEVVTAAQSNSGEAKKNEASGLQLAFGKKAKATLSPTPAKLESRETPNLPEGSRLEAGGKTFVLRDHVWTDLSIADADSYSRVFISRTSSNYPALVKPLAVYQKLLSRPEDVRVLHEGKVYWISNRSEPPEKQ